MKEPGSKKTTMYKYKLQGFKFAVSKLYIHLGAILKNNDNIVIYYTFRRYANIMVML